MTPFTIFGFKLILVVGARELVFLLNRCWFGKRNKSFLDVFVQFNRASYTSQFSTLHFLITFLAV